MSGEQMFARDKALLQEQPVVIPEDLQAAAVAFLLSRLDGDAARECAEILGLEVPDAVQ